MYLFLLKVEISNLNFSFIWLNSLQKFMASLFTRFLDHTQRSTTFDRTHLEKWSASRRNLYLTTYNTHNRQTSESPLGFEPNFSAGEQPQTYSLDRAATGTGQTWTTVIKYTIFIFWLLDLMMAICFERHTKEFVNTTNIHLWLYFLNCKLVSAQVLGQN